MSSQGNMKTIRLIKFLDSVHRKSGFWVPEKGIFWEPDSNTEDSDEESTNSSRSDGSGTDGSSDRPEDEYQ